MNATPSARYASVLRPGLFEGRVLWVTGGGSGIGRCIAHELASLGARVVISGRTQDKLQRVAAEIAEDGGCADSIAFDIRDEDAVKAAVAGIVAKHDRIDGLVNNAGGQVICFLLSPAAAFVTGITVQIDGGASLASPLWSRAEHSNSQPFDGFHRAVTPEVLK